MPTRKLENRDSLGLSNDLGVELPELRYSGGVETNRCKSMVGHWREGWPKLSVTNTWCCGSAVEGWKQQPSFSELWEIPILVVQKTLLFIQSDVIVDPS